MARQASGTWSRGKETRPSAAVLDSLARVLHRNDQEHRHLRELAARAARYTPEPLPAPSRVVRPHLKLLLDMTAPATRPARHDAAHESG